MFLILFFMLFPWFVRAFTGRQSRRWVMGSAALWAVLLIIHTTDPYTLQYATVEGL